MKYRQLTRYALRSLGQGGQRLLIAVVAVAFGVMSLVTMITLSAEVERVLLVDEGIAVGGDIHLWRDSGYLAAESLAQIEEIQAGGHIAQYALVAHSPALVVKTPESGRVTFLQGGAGFDPQAYPLVGEITLGQPANAVPTDVLKNPGDVIITADLAGERDLSLGDTILVANRIGGTPVALQVSGIAIDTPDHKGQQIFYGLETAATIAGHPQPVTDVYALWGGDPEPAVSALNAAGWKMTRPDYLGQTQEEVRGTFSFMLKGAGILGLLVAGVGIANTMNVLLARRRKEVATLKSLGYSRGDVVLLFVVETAVIGLTGGLLGLALAAGLSLALVTMISDTITLFLAWRLDPLLLAGGLAIGVVTSVLFALQAILQASDARPADLFREAPAESRGTWLRSLAVYGLMAIPFVLIASLILGSVVQGVSVLLGALAGLLVLGLILGGILWLALRFLPTFRFNLLRMARNNMRRRGMRLIFAIIVLFLGVFALGLSVTIIFDSMEEYGRRSFSDEGYNVVVLADLEQEEAARATLAELAAGPASARYSAPLGSVTVEGSTVTGFDAPPILQGRGPELWDVSVEGAAWGSQPEGVYLPADLDLPPAGEVLLTTAAGEQRRLPVVGVYSPLDWDEGLIYPAAGLLVGRNLLLELSGDDASITVAAEGAPADLEQIGEAAGRALPQATVITSFDVDNVFSSMLRSLFYFAVSMAGLALLAAAVLIANSVSLGMIERRYEIGVLKAMGFTRKDVLVSLLLEYGLVAVIASVTGLAAVEIFVVIVQVAQETADDLISVDPLTAVVIVALSTGLILLTALAVAWRPVQVRPRLLLNRHGG